MNIVFICRVALLVLGPNAFCRFHSNNEVAYVLTGLHKARIRQLKIKGFKVIEVSFELAFISRIG